MKDRVGPKSWGILILLTLISIISLLDRQIISILAVEIKKDLGLNDGEIGLIYGTFFGIFYALFAIPLGKLADSWDRTKQIAATIITWCAATIGCGLSGGFVSMSAFRATVAAGESGVGPASNSMLADLFPSRLRGIAFGILMTQATLGMGLSIWFGGAFLGYWNNTFENGIGWFGLSGWRAAFIVAALPGFILALIMLFVKDPVRGKYDGVTVKVPDEPVKTAAKQFLNILPGLNLYGAKKSGASSREVSGLLGVLLGIFVLIWLLSSLLNSITPPDKLTSYGEFLGIPITTHFIQVSIILVGLYAAGSWVFSQRRNDPAGFKALWSKRTYIYLIIFACAQLAVAFGFNAFSAPYAIEKFSLGPAIVGPKVGISLMAGGFLGVVTSGFLAEWLRRRFVTGRLMVMVGSALLTIPFGLWTLSQDTLDGFVYAFFGMNFVKGMFYPCCMASVADIMPPLKRGIAVAMMNLSFTIIGQGIGPYAVGSVSHATGELGFALKCILVLSIVAAVAGVMAMQYVAEDEIVTSIEKKSN